MSDLQSAFLYENLTPVYHYNNVTRLCMYEPTGALYIVKDTDLENEAYFRSLLAIHSPYLAQVRYVKKETDHISVMLDYVAGESLAERLKGGNTLAEEKALYIATALCSGLNELHKAGLVHRDVTPGNIILDASGKPVLIDYGILRSYKEDKGNDTVILGTPGYAAPEQFGFTQSDARTDIYALGVLINVMLTGKFPNQKQATGKLQRTVIKCTAIDAENRYKSAAQLEKELLRIKKQTQPDLGSDNFLNLIPGLRTTSKILIVFSLFAYAVGFLICYILYFPLPERTLTENLLSLLCFVLCVAIPYVCLGDAFLIWEKVTGRTSLSRRTVKVLFGLLASFSWATGLFLFGQLL